MAAAGYLYSFVARTARCGPARKLYNLLYVAFVSSGIKTYKRRFLLERLPKHAVCAEVGVWSGQFSRAIHRISQPRECYLVDPWEYLPEAHKRHYRAFGADGQLYMDRLHDSVARSFRHAPEMKILRAYSHIAAAQFPDGYFDWVYIDGNHYYDYVKQDLEAWYPKIKKGGYLTGDDYFWQDEQGVGGVEKAVQEFVGTHTVTSFEVKHNQYMIGV